MKVANGEMLTSIRQQADTFRYDLLSFRVDPFDMYYVLIPRLCLALKQYGSVGYEQKLCTYESVIRCWVWEVKMQPSQPKAVSFVWFNSLSFIQRFNLSEHVSGAEIRAERAEIQLIGSGEGSGSKTDVMSQDV